MTNPYDQQANPYSGQPDATKETDAQTQNSQQNAGNPQGGDALPQETQSNVMKSQAYVVSCLACGQEGTRANVPQTLACRCGSRNLVYEAAEDLDAVSAIPEERWKTTDKSRESTNGLYGYLRLEQNI